MLVLCGCAYAAEGLHRQGMLMRDPDGCCRAVALQAAAVLGEIAAVDPAEYERQQNASGEKAGVRSVAAFVKEMAAQLPRCVRLLVAGAVHGAAAGHLESPG